jgi:DNA-directed RNA polymerase specialized sigma24 family protein
VTDRREKERLFRETVAKYTQWLGGIARNNAPKGSCQDLQREIFMSLWKS